MPLQTGEEPNLVDLIAVRDSREAEQELLSLLDGKRDTVQFAGNGDITNNASLRWTLWRVPARNGELGPCWLWLKKSGALPTPRTSAAGSKTGVLGGRLAGGVAHDFNNVLTGVLLYCDLLMASLDSSHAARKYAEEVRKAALQASGLVKHLLAITRPRSLGDRSFRLTMSPRHAQPAGAPGRTRHPARSFVLIQTLE